MTKPKILKKRMDELNEAVEHYKLIRTDFEHMGQMLQSHLVEDSILRHLIHSGMYRSKDPDHLLDKLIRKEHERIQDMRKRSITKNNLFKSIHDLAGVRLLHLHTQQMYAINERISEIFSKNKYKVIEAPVVYIWDIEHKTYFEKIGIKTIERPEMYTSVHYVVSPAHRPDLRIELQVRTLMEEVWGEVSHTINYPHPTKVKSCQEQLRALARLTSGCTRLVDSIFNTQKEYGEE